ncbi:collagen alpha-6(VI) chain-like [Hypanus sabinus]|uniref:collagen alpha-6(VI) chain-like n=1 Tax=Hypanus sabinus TaxID=79690 RepID=UPI0028C435D8|nr:collagen alpha-6(VI) chain-like [Hypanus sabinus]
MPPPISYRSFAYVFQGYFMLFVMFVQSQTKPLILKECLDHRKTNFTFRTPGERSRPETLTGLLLIDAAWTAVFYQHFVEMNRRSIKMVDFTTVLISLLFAMSLPSASSQQTACRDATVADIVLVIDGSSSVKDDNFQNMKIFLHKFVRGLDIASNKVRIGLAQYSTDPKTEFLLNTYLSKENVLDHIKKLSQTKGGTNVTKVLEFLDREHFVMSAGSRIEEGVKQIAILITDGGSITEAAKAAEQLRSRNITIFVIGVNVQPAKALRLLSSKPFNKYAYNIARFDKLSESEFSNRFLESVCRVVVDYIQAYAVDYADVVFLVDTSLKMGSAGFQRIQKAILNVVSQLEIGADKFQVGLAQYSTGFYTEFLLSAFQTNAQVTRYIKDPSNFVFQGRLEPAMGNAIDVLNKGFFRVSAGSRRAQGVPQIAIIFSSAPSLDDVTAAAREIRKQGVKAIAVGVKNANQTELEKIAPPEFIFQSDDFGVFAQLPSKIYNAIKLIIKQEYLYKIYERSAACTTASIADVVFLVDTSDDIGVTNFQLIRGFLQGLINTLDITADRVRVGLAQYSALPKEEFKLTTYHSKSDILDHVRSMPYRGGRGRKTSAALHFVRENYFTALSGSRVKKGIPQMLFLITGGEFQTEDEDSAISLRRNGVNIFTLGIGNVTENELEKIASYPSKRYVLRLEDFLMLSPAADILQNRICLEVISQTSGTAVEENIIKEACTKTEEADIYFLVDGSSSISAESFMEVKQFLIKVIKDFTIGANQVRIGVVQYSKDPQTEFTVTEYTNKTSLEEAVERISQIRKTTWTGRALSYMKDLFSKAKESRKHEVHQVLITLTDGEADDNVEEPARDLKQQGIICYAIGVGKAIEEELKQVAGGTEERVYYVTNFDALDDIKNNIVRAICSQEACSKMGKSDIIFLIDGSGSISPTDFQKMKEFMHSFVNRTTISPENVHMGLIQYAADYRLEFNLVRYSSQDDIRKAITAVRQIGGGTMTGSALSFTEEYFAQSKGGRPGIPQYLIVITDGEAQDEVLGPATSIRNEGIIVFAVGVSEANVSQLLEIGGSQDKVHYVEDFTQLEDLDQKIYWEICSHVDTCLRTDEADIVFVIDGSINTEPDEFKQMKIFMLNMVNNSVVSSSNVQFGAILYSDAPNILFQLSQSMSKTEISEAINKMSLAAEAADITPDLKLAKELLANGSRSLKGDSQFITVMTNRKDIDSLQQSLEADIGQSEATVITVSPSSGKEEVLVGILDVDKKRFNNQKFDSMVDVIKKTSELICNKTNPDCVLEKADIIFLMDGSSSINKVDFDEMKSFLKRLIDIFTIHPSKVQIGLAQFSSEFQKIADLKDFSTKESLQAKLDQVTQMGGGTRIGFALQNLVSMFTKEAGSRSATGEPQNLVVLTDGESQDEVGPPADRLRQDNRNIFVVGIGNVKPRQLLRISGSRSNIFQVQNFQGLKKIKKRFVRSICTERPSSVCSIDIAMGLDLSNHVGFLESHGSHLIGIIERMMDLQNISCKSGNGITTKIGFHRSSSNFDLQFKQFKSNEIREELMSMQNDNRILNADYLQSFSRLFSLKAEGNVKVIVIVTDGIDDEINKLKQVSEKLRLKEDIHGLIFVPLEGTENADKIAELEFGRGFGYREELMINKPDIGNELLKAIDTIAERECCKIICKCSGQLGNRGDRGKRGSLGLKGQKGFQGYEGEEGKEGSRGGPGITGARGEDGCQGPNGHKGSRGRRGQKGDTAANGLVGIVGEEGDPGIPGVDGEKGADGNTGSKGIQGPKGDRGEPGLQGDTGASGVDNYSKGRKGDKGQRGIQGEFGQRGRPGKVGQDGNKGRPGRRGAMGIEGRSGQPGTRGSLGPPGFQGQKGTNGIPGLPGRKGEIGLSGPQGSIGDKGFRGHKGSDGFKGQKGEDGPKGQKGEFGRTGVRGLQGMDGIDMVGNPGPNGRKGEPGFPGYLGPQGPDGDPGTPGERGPKGSRGRRGDSGQPGEPGNPGEGGAPGTRGLKGSQGKTSIGSCELLSYIRNNCPCCSSKSSECPVYPLDLVFALDLSSDVSPAKFNRMKRIVKELVQDLKITKGTCPEGARVAVLTYSSTPKMFIRFSEHRSVEKFLQSLQDLAYERSARRQDIGSAMRFVARNTFKHTRGGILTRNVAVFITNGPSEDKSAIVTAALEFSALDITPVVISFADVPDIQLAFQVDDTRTFRVASLSEQQRQVQEQLRTIRLCTLCFDMCQPRAQCQHNMSPPPISISMDMAFVVDGSHNMKTMDFERIKYFLTSMLDMFVISRRPDISDNYARVAMVQHSPADYVPGTGQKPVNLEFGFLKYNSKNIMKKYIKESFNKLDGPSRVGHAIEWTMNNVFSSNPVARRHKVIFVILAGGTSALGMERLSIVSKEARCKGFAVFTVFLGKETGRFNLDTTVSFPFNQHFLHLGGLLDSEMNYAKRFARAFLKSLTLEINDYPPPQLKEECDALPGHIREYNLRIAANDYLIPEWSYRAD